MRTDVITTDTGVGTLKNHFTFSGVIFLELFFLSVCKPIKIPENCGMKYSRLNANENNIFETKDSPNLENDNIVAPGVKKSNVNKDMSKYVGNVFFKDILIFCDNIVINKNN